MVVQLGMDVGQQRDPTAIVLAERLLRPRDDGRGSESVFLIRHIERLRLRTPYRAVVEHVHGLVSQINESADETLDLVIDATGVGTPVADELRKRLAGQRVRILDAVFTGGESLDLRNIDPKSIVRERRVSVPKMGLVARLQALLSWRRIRLPETKMARALADELRDFEIRPSGTNDIAGAFRTGAHDDLVIALGLATLELRRVPRIPPTKDRRRTELASDEHIEEVVGVLI